MDAIEPKRFLIYEKRKLSKPSTKSKFFDINQNIEVKFVKIVAGYNHSAAIDQLGRLWTWGANSEMCLGHFDQENRIEPTIVDCLKEFKIIDVGLGDKFMVVITVNRNDYFESIYSRDFRNFIYVTANKQGKIQRREIKKTEAN